MEQDLEVLKVVALNFKQQIRVDGRLDEQENIVN